MRKIVGGELLQAQIAIRNLRDEVHNQFGKSIRLTVDAGNFCMPPCISVVPEDSSILDDMGIKNRYGYYEFENFAIFPTKEL